jgi:thiosulfate/3-mercaptopyruvate sulfurtransferase
MKIKLSIVLAMYVVVSSLCLFNNVNAEDNEFESGIVSVEWLNNNHNMDNMVIIDIRPEELYKAGHIPNSVNIPFEAIHCIWVNKIFDPGNILQMPEKDTLSKNLGKYGINSRSKIVVVTNFNPKIQIPPPSYAISGATRVATTLLYAGVKQVSVLDGGYEKWVAEKNKTSTKIPKVKLVNFNGIFNNSIIVDMKYVKSKIGKSTIIDARDLEVYDGTRKPDFALKSGHIKTAISLPAINMWNYIPGDLTYNKDNDGTYLCKDMLNLIAGKAISDKKSEIILYCGVGGYASSWYFVLTQVLDYKNVKIYDGSAQEWSRHYEMYIEK